MAIRVEGTNVGVSITDTDTGAKLQFDAVGAKRLIAALLTHMPFQHEAMECVFCDSGAFKANKDGGNKWCCSGCGREMKITGGP